MDGDKPVTNEHGVTVWCPCGCGARQVRHSAACEDVQAAWLAHCDRNDSRPAPYELVKATSICADWRGNSMTNPSLFQQQYEWEREFAKGNPDGVTCQIPDCRGHVNWGWCSEHTALHYRELP